MEPTCLALHQNQHSQSLWAGKRNKKVDCYNNDDADAVDNNDDDDFEDDNDDDDDDDDLSAS